MFTGEPRVEIFLDSLSYVSHLLLPTRVHLFLAKMSLAVTSVSHIKATIHFLTQTLQNFIGFFVSLKSKNLQTASYINVPMYRMFYILSQAKAA